MQKKNITLNEVRSLVKEMINEYDIDSFNDKYSNLPSDRKDKVSNYLGDRQVRDGIRLIIPNKNANHTVKEFFCTKNDVLVYRLSDNIRKAFDNLPSLLERLNKSNDISLSQLDKLTMQYVDFYNKEPSKVSDNIRIMLEGRIDNLINKDKNFKSSLDIKISLSLEKQNDKYKPPFKAVVNSINMSFSDGTVMVPADVKDARVLATLIKSQILNEYGKFDSKKSLFITDIVIGKNSFYKLS
jgi:hypothetical protein